MKENKSLMVISVMSLIVIILGATFSYFNISAQTNENAISLSTATIDVELNATPLYIGKDLIPMNDDDVMKGYAQDCIDDNEYGACHVYEISLINNGDSSGYIGTINFNINEIEHLKYLLLDDNDEIYVDKTAIVSGTDQSLGNSFVLNSGETKTFKLIIWLSNYEYEQNDEDGGGSYTASVTYTSVSGSRITGTFSANG